jgi:hypothetical protein
MIWIISLLTTPLFAQIDLSAIQKLSQELPQFSTTMDSEEGLELSRQNRRFKPPVKITRMNEIKDSGTQYGAIKEGGILRGIESNQNYKTLKLTYIKYFNLEDEFGFKYIQNNDGTITWKIPNRFVESVQHELVLSVPPHRYTPAPDNIPKTIYDKTLTIPPEFSFHVGLIQGDFMRDLFEDKKASNGLSRQFGLHLFTQWKLPVKAGAVVQFETATYGLRNGGEVQYSSYSIGPQIKTKDFDISGNPVRFQSHFRVGPLARATAETASGSETFKFNSADLLASIESPVKNRFGEFVFGIYFQRQWLSIREQTVPVSLKATNETNKSYGVSFAQVFE